jgi:hypothetical protein
VNVLSRDQQIAAISSAPLAAIGGRGHCAAKPQRGSAMAYIYLVQMNIPAEHEAEFNRVYDTEHVPMLSKVPGVHSVTRYRLESSEDPRMQKYLAIYEVDSPDVVSSAAWQEAGEWGQWAPKIRPLTTERYRSFFKKIP